ncbi:hypothetical protein PAMP_024240 [Pampus punctatissimus]
MSNIILHNIYCYLDVATAAIQHSATAEDRNQKENQDQAAKTKSDGKTKAHLAKRQGQKISSNREGISVYFHAITSKHIHLDPDKDFVILKSGTLFGNWDDGVKMTFSKCLGDKRYLVEHRESIDKNLIRESIPYKYAVYKFSL